MGHIILVLEPSWGKEPDVITENQHPSTHSQAMHSPSRERAERVLSTCGQKRRRRRIRDYSDAIGWAAICQLRELSIPHAGFRRLELVIDDEVEEKMARAANNPPTLDLG